MIFSAFSYKAIKPLAILFLKSSNFFDYSPPNTSIHSCVNLKGAYSITKPLPGALLSKNPKSMCEICPSISIIILPLCRSFTYKIYVINEYAASELQKFLHVSREIICSPWSRWWCSFFQQTLDACFHLVHLCKLWHSAYQCVEHGWSNEIWKLCGLLRWARWARCWNSLADAIQLSNSKLECLQRGACLFH